MKNHSKLLILTAFLTIFILIGCIEDTTVYWPESLAFREGPGWKTRIGDWQTNHLDRLTFHNSPSNRWAKLSVYDSDTDTTTDYYLVSYEEGESFVIVKDNTEYTIEYTLENDILTITDNDNSAIKEDSYDQMLLF